MVEQHSCHSALCQKKKDATAKIVCHGCQRSGARVGLKPISGILHRSLDDTQLPSLIQIDSHATRHELLASLCVLPHFWCVQMHLLPLTLMGSCFAAPNSHVGPHWKGFLLSSNLPIAVEQDGPAALVLVQQTAVLEVGHQVDLALQVWPACQGI